MNRIFINILIFFFLINNQTMSEENIMILKIKDGDDKIELFEDIAPNHVKRIKELANNEKQRCHIFHY
jgi:peptidyl-prolyl cis-trans isomerase B (cyclophilin B)